MKIALHHNPRNRRSTAVAFAMYDGAAKLGFSARCIPHFEQPEGDVGVAYGWGHPHLFEAYRRAGGHFVYIDLGWWNRKPPHNVLGGYHKVCVDGREPNAYFRRNFPADRFARTGLEIKPWRATGSHVLIAGMSEKSARTRGLEPQRWETAMAVILREVCPHRPIIYRPKPSWVGAWPIEGTIYSPPSQPLEAVLRDCWAVVAHHSNVTVDALLAGVPICCKGGVAIEASTPSLSLHLPRTDCDRAGLMADIAYAQWSAEEMRDGTCLRHLLENTPLCA